MRRIVAKFRKGERAQALVEFGLVSVVFFMFIFGIMDGARLFQSWMTVQHAARESARYAVTGPNNICSGAGTRDACIIWTAKKATTGISGGGTSGSAVTVTTRAWDYDGWSGTGTANVAGKPCDQIEVTVSYTHHFMTPIIEAIVPSGVTIKGSQRMTNEPWAACNVNDGVS